LGYKLLNKPIQVESSPQSALDTIRGHGQAKTVLLVEQGRLSQAFLSRLFKSLGFEPVLANSIEIAMQQLKKIDPMLICMNRYTEGFDVIQFANKVRKSGSNIPLLLLTADQTNKIRAKALKAGITEVLSKKNVPELAERITNFVKNKVLPTLTRGHVLYVEDSRTQSVTVIKLLKAMALKVDHTTTAEAAIELFQKNDKYDLVITDVLLKGEKSGLSVISHIRGLKNQKSRIPILTLTGFDQVARRIELLRAGTNDYIVKPVVREELVVRVTNLISNKQLMDEVIRQKKLLHEMAITDQLTGCHNRHGFAEITEKYLATARRRKEKVSLLMLDLDYFKQVNDVWGHDKGDLVLKEVGLALRESCREGDVVSRMGGEEFVVFLSNCPKKDAIAMGQRIRKKIENLRPGDLDITTSIGVTTMPASHDIDDALSVADKAVYRAKNRGRNCVSFKACS
jgi:two-component system cell cycle response regulator